MPDETPIKEKIDDVKDDTKETSNMITTANEAAVRLEDANKEFRGLLDRQERLKVEGRLGGQTEAGTPAEKKVESDADYAKRVLGGNLDVK